MKEILKKQRKSNKGITLIALVITIIVLLILVGVSIATLAGDNGILTKANTAKERIEIATVIEKAQTDIFGVQAENEGKITKEQFIEILNKYFNGVPKVEDLPEDLSTLILTTKKEYGNYEIKISEIYKGSFSNVNTVPEKTIEDLQAGEKVYYDTGVTSVGNNGVVECVVLYDKAYNDANRTNYGVQIITADTIENDISLGYDDPTVTEGSTNFEKARNSYNNAIKTLNREAEKYLNTTYATDSRCVGSVPDNKNLESDYHSNSYEYFTSYNGTVKDNDENYLADWTQMGTNKLNIVNLGKSYWMASRFVYSCSTNSDFHVRNVNSSGGLGSDYLCFVYAYGDVDGRNYLNNLRPVFILKSGIKITEGDGNTTPYTLAP